MQIELPQEKFHNAEWFYVTPDSLPPAHTGYRVHTAWGSFGNYKSERAAAYLLRFFQERKMGWCRFTLRDFLSTIGVYLKGIDTLTIDDITHCPADISDLYGLYIQSCGKDYKLEELNIDWPLVVSTEFVERLREARWQGAANFGF